MKSLFSSRFLATAAVAVAAVAGAGVAHARTDLVVTIGAPATYGYVQGNPYGYAHPAPVYVQPRPVYVQPHPVYVQPHVSYGHGYGHDRAARRGPWGDEDRDGIVNARDRDSRYYQRQVRQNGPWGDLDRDGVPNAHDRAPQNPYYR